MPLRRSARGAPAVKLDDAIDVVATKARKTATNKVPIKVSEAVDAPATVVKAQTTKTKAPKAVKPSKASKPDAAMPPPPSTPQKKRKHGEISASNPPPATPTPSAIGLMTAPVSTPTQAAIREAQPHMTNAPLQTPGGSKILPRVTEHLEPGATTANILDKACAHLISVDPTLAAVIAKNPCRIFSPEGLAEPIDPFRSLVSGICGQQVSGAAAKSIKNKFVALFNADKPEGAPHDWPQPARVAATDLATLRTAGLSQRKAEYIQGLAEKFASGELTAQMLAEAGDDEIMERLIAVRGLGRWSVEMFACFALKRFDIFSTGDLGVQRGMAAYAGRDVSKLKAKGGGKWKYMSEKDMVEISDKFRPYRSLFMWLMWRIEDVDTSVMNA